MPQSGLERERGLAGRIFKLYHYREMKQLAYLPLLAVLLHGTLSMKQLALVVLALATTVTTFFMHAYGAFILNYIMTLVLIGELYPELGD